MKHGQQGRMAYHTKARELVSRLSLWEKISLMSGSTNLKDVLNEQEIHPEAHYNHVPYSAGGNKRERLSPVNFCDGPRGVVCGTGVNTCFPVTSCRGATFDVELEYEIGRAMGKETKACGGNLFAGTCVNLLYHPGWGRAQETYGEDSFHLGEMGSALVRGVQEEDVIACVKHFAFNQMEISRFKVNIECSKRTEREVFLPHFKKCIDAGAGCVMTSYNKYRGEYCGENAYLNNQVLKGEWGFEGFLMSDFGWGIRDTVRAANGGQTMEMPGTEHFGEHLYQSVKQGEVSEDVIDDAAIRIVRTILEFSDREQKEEVDYQADRRLALRAAREGITLLENDGNVLPLQRGPLRKLLVAGKLADRENIGDHGSSRVYPPYVVTPLRGLQKALTDTEILFEPDPEIARKVAEQEPVDAAILIVGCDYNDEGEFLTEEQADNYTGARGGDRITGVRLKAEDEALIESIGAVVDRTIVVLIGGGMILPGPWIHKVPSVLMAYYPGMEGGTALAEILLGDISPSGKLPFVIPQEETDLPQITWDTMQQRYEYFHGYAKLEHEGKEPMFPFGFGRSYTDFRYFDLRTWVDQNADNGAETSLLTAQCSVQNVGDMTGDEVVQLYIGFPETDKYMEMPHKRLKGFQRCSLKPGEKVLVEIICPLKELMIYDETIDDFVMLSGIYTIYMGSSSADRDLLKLELEIP